MVCDIVYTHIDAIWGFPEIKLACYPPVACAALAALVGQKRATQLIVTGESIQGRDAMLIGLATASGAPPECEAMLRELLTRLSALSPAALALAKKAVYAWDGLHLDKGIARAEKIYLEELMKTDDVKEGVDAFMQKRKPVWSGK